MTHRVAVKIAKKEYVVRKPNPFLFWRPKQIIELLTHDLETVYTFDTDAVPIEISKDFAWVLEFTNKKQIVVGEHAVSYLNHVGTTFEISTQRGNIKRVLIVERTV